MFPEKLSASILFEKLLSINVCERGVKKVKKLKNNKLLNNKKLN